MVTAIFGAASIIGLHFLYAQDTMIPVQSGPISLGVTNITTLGSLTDAQLEQLTRVLAATPTVLPGVLPSGGMGGTFYSLQNPEWPPLPADVRQLPVWDFGNYFYLLDDLDVNYATPPGQLLVTETSGMQMTAADVPSPPGSGGGGGYGSNSQSQPPTTNDLWLQEQMTNTTASLVINPPWNVTNGVYDLFYTTNLAPPSTWVWVTRCAPGQTNLTVTGLGDPQGFFILGTMELANDGSGLTVAYENLVGSTFSSDGYGTPNAWYLQNNINPLASGVATQDPDQDGLLNYQEYLYGTNPNVSEGFAVWVSTPNATSSIP